MLLWWLMLTPLCSADDSLVRIEEKLTTDRAFYDQWMNLITLQNRQKNEQTLDNPLSYALEDVVKCGKNVAQSQDSANGLRPDDIGILAEMGHLSTYCPSDYELLKEGVLEPCTRKGSTMTLPSLDSLFRTRNANLTSVTINNRDDLLSEQARALASTIKQIPDYETTWKMIVIIPSIQDGEASETGQTAVEVLTSIEELNRLLPFKTFVVVVRSSGIGLWHDASHSHHACREMLTRWKGHSKFNSNSVWDQVDQIVEKNFMRSNFTVEILPLLRNSALVNLPDNSDLSSLGFDCAHFSERGLSMLHIAIWNSLVSRTSDRKQDYRPVPEKILCPDPRCPFLRTEANSAYCIWSPIENGSFSVAPQLIVISVLVLALILFILVLCCLCRRQHRTDDIRNPIKAFGASFSSIKFIDEDVI